MTSNILEPARTWLTNRRWSLRDIDEIREPVAGGWDNPSLAEAYLVDEEELAAMLERNGIRRRPRPGAA